MIIISRNIIFIFIEQLKDPWKLLTCPQSEPLSSEGDLPINSASHSIFPHTTSCFRIESRIELGMWLGLSACLACFRQWVSFPAPKKEGKKKSLRRLLESNLKHELWIIKTDYTLEKDHTSKILYLHHFAWSFPHSKSTHMCIHTQVFDEGANKNNEKW